jgi:hypothetical protein
MAPPKLSLRQRQLQSRLKEVEDNFIRSFDVRQSNENTDATYKKNVGLLKELRTKARKMGVPFRGNQELINASDEYRQDRLIRGQEAGYGSGGIDKKTGERKFASNIDREGDTYSFDLVESIKQGKPVGNIYGRKTILNNPVMDAFDVFSILAGVGLGVKAAKAVIKDPSLILKYPKSVQNKVQSVFSNSKGNKSMSKKAVVEPAKEWMKKVLKGTQAGMRKELQKSIDAGKSAAEVKLLKSILKQDGSINQTKLGKLTPARQSKVQALVGGSSKGSGKGANVAVAALAGGATGGIAADKLDLEMPDLPDSLTSLNPRKTRREREQKQSDKFDPSERQKKIDAEKTKTTKAKQSAGSRAEMGGGDQPKKKVVKKSTTPPASAPNRPKAPKVSQAEKDKGKDELSVEKQSKKLDISKRKPDVDTSEGDAKRGQARSAAQKLATQEKKSTETTKKKKDEPKKKGRFAQGKRTIDTGFGKITIDSTDEAMRTPDDDLNLRKGGMPKYKKGGMAKAFGKGGMYKTPKKAYGMKYGGFTRRGMGK